MDELRQLERREAEIVPAGAEENVAAQKIDDVVSSLRYRQVKERLSIPVVGQAAGRMNAERFRSVRQKGEKLLPRDLSISKFIQDRTPDGDLAIFFGLFLLSFIRRMRAAIFR